MWPTSSVCPLWDPAAQGCAVLRCLRRGADAGRPACRIQAGDDTFRRRGAVDGYRGRIGPERLREVMTELVDRSAWWCSATGAPWTSSPVTASWRCSVRRSLGRHAFRACLAALDIQRVARPAGRRGRPPGRHRTAVARRLEFRPGDRRRGRRHHLGYTAVGEQVGMAQRMESVAPPGGVMLSESTARRVEDRVVLGEPRRCTSKASTPACRRAPAGRGRRTSTKARHESRLVGRRSEKNAIAELLDQAGRRREPSSQ